MDILKLVEMGIGLAGYKDNKKAKAKDFIKDNMKFSAVLMTVVSIIFTGLAFYAPEIARQFLEAALNLIPVQ